MQTFFTADKEVFILNDVCKEIIENGYELPYEYKKGVIIQYCSSVNKSVNALSRNTQYCNDTINNELKNYII